MSFKNSKKRSAKDYKIGRELDFATLEAYNYLRTNLSFKFPDKEGCKIIGITSSLPVEGKSFTSVNLAYVLAESGLNVLLIDADMRKPSLGNIFKAPKRKGLSNFLAEGEMKIVNKNMLTDNLSVIFSGDTPPNPSELIGSKTMKKIIDNLSEKFDYIILDLPPVNSVSDPIIVSKYLDGIIMVVKHRYTKRREIASAVRQLKNVEANIIGFVYNGFSENSRYFKKSTYYKNYYYGKG